MPCIGFKEQAGPLQRSLGAAHLVCPAAGNRGIYALDLPLHRTCVLQPIEPLGSIVNVILTQAC